MKRPPLRISIDLSDTTRECDDNDNFSAGDATYCHDGLSIGQNYLRFEGATFTRGELDPHCLSFEETIGKGAFCKVQRAVWKRPSKSQYPSLLTRESSSFLHVAIKQYPLLLGHASQQKRKMLIQELKSLCRVQCPSLVELHGAFLEDNSVTLVIEYMDRGSLEHVIDKRQQKPFTQPMVAGVAYQLLHGLNHLHNQRILHRDIKSENCLMNSTGHVKLCDFGVASLGDQSLYQTVIGSTYWMAPERLRAKQYGRSSDIWSFALVLCHVVTGEKPWSDVTSIVDLLVTIEDTPANHFIPKNVDRGLKEILENCLQISPSKRMPASLLLRSPWFSRNHNIHSLKHAARRIIDGENQNFVHTTCC